MLKTNKNEINTKQTQQSSNRSYQLKKLKNLSSSKKKKLSKTQIYYSPTKSFATNYKNLPRKTTSKQLPVTKSAEDPTYNYKYKQIPTQLDKRSNLPQIQQFIITLIKKSYEFQLTTTEKYMLGGYIQAYIQQNFQNFHPNQIKDTARVQFQLTKLTNAWKLYQYKFERCKIGIQDDTKQKHIQHGFNQIIQQISKYHKDKQKLQLIKKLIKKFYLELIS